MRLKLVCLACLIPWLTSCVSHPIWLAAVGPSPGNGSASAQGLGRLQVYSETRQYIDDDIYYSPHSGYQIETPQGKRVRYIWNHNSHQDENPEVVALPAGRYLIQANAQLCGRVLVPVVIRPNQTTRVVLEPGWKPQVSSSGLVHSPCGYNVGWRADLPPTP